MFEPAFALHFWGFLVLYGTLMYAITPQARTVSSFFAGTDILKATTISGTMVMGLAPVFLLAPLVNYSPWSFHLAFWPGVVLGVMLAGGAIPDSWTIGDGKYASLLGTSLYGLAICFAGFLLALAFRRLRPAERRLR
jgi:hypothetical protein